MLKKFASYLALAGLFIHMQYSCCTPLTIAITTEAIGVANELIAMGADPNEKDWLGNTPLSLATGRKLAAVVSELLKHGANPNEKTSWGAPIVFGAIDNKSQEIVSAFLKAGLDLNIKDGYGQTLLYKAIKNHSLAIVNALLDVRANPNEKYYESPLYEAMAEKLPEIAKALLKHGANPNEKTSWGTPIVFGAIKKKSQEIVSAFLKAGLDLNIKDGYGQTLLHKAIKKHSLEIVNALLVAGANPNEKYYNSPLYEAIDQKLPEIAKALLKHGADPNEKSYNSLRYEAIAKEFPEISEALLKHGAPNEKGYGAGIIFDAVLKNCPEIVTALIKAGADAHKVDFMCGESPLSIAIKNNYSDVVKALLQADITLQKDNFSSIRTAIDKNYPEVVAAILKVGGKPDEKDECGCSHLHLATIEQKLPIVKALVENGANVNVKNFWGYTPRNYAGKGGEIDAYLTQHGGKIGSLSPYIKLALCAIGTLAATTVYCNRYNIADWWYGYDGSQPLHKAVRWGKLSEVQELINSGENIKARDNNGFTAWHYANIFKRTDVKSLLIRSRMQRGAHFNLHTSAPLVAGIKNVNEEDIYGNTRLYYAVKHNRMAIIKDLLSKGAEIDVKLFDLTNDLTIKVFLWLGLFNSTKDDQTFAKCIAEYLKCGDGKLQFERLICSVAEKRDRQFADRFYDVINKKFTPQERLAFGFNYATVEDFYLALTRSVPGKEEITQRWIHICLQLCKGPIFDNVCHGDFRDKMRSHCENYFNLSEQQKIKKYYEDTFLRQQIMHETLVIPRHLRMPEVSVAQEKIGFKKKFMDMKIFVPKKK